MYEIDTILDEFNGQISIQEILNLTLKELAYLRHHRANLNLKKMKQVLGSGDKVT